MLLENSQYLAQHYNTSLFRNYIDVLRNSFGDQFVDDFLASLPLPASYITSDDNWISAAFVQVFYDRLIELGVDEVSAYDAGRFSMTADSNGTMHFFLLKMLSLDVIFSQVHSIARRYNKKDEINVLRESERSVVIHLTSTTEIATDRYWDFVTANWIGVIEGIFMAHGVGSFDVRMERIGEGETKFYAKWEKKCSWIDRLLSLFGLETKNKVYLDKSDQEILNVLLNQHESRYKTLYKNMTKAKTLSENIQKYVAPSVAKNLDKNPSTQTAEKVEATVLFSDMRGFTERSNDIPPEILLQTLSCFHEEVSHIIYEYGGHIDKFLGDGAMVLFNGYSDLNNHQDAAISCAMRIQECMPMINQKISDLIAGRVVGWSPIKIGIGIHTGEVVIGNIGSEKKLEYTAVGQTVNIAARLQGMTKKFPGIIISDETVSQVKGNYQLVSVGECRIRGVKEKVKVHHWHNEDWSLSLVS